jgi:hypothetical protein
MNTSKKTARIVGVLFLIVNVAFILGAAVFIEPILSAPDYINLVSTNRTQVILGVLLELINGIAYVSIAVLMFPILRQSFESIALGYVGFRVVEFVMQILSDISPLSLLTLSDKFTSAGMPDSVSLHTLGILLLADRESAFLLISITFGLGALMFYYVLYQLKLIPRFISIWGLIGATLVLINTIFDMFGLSIPNLGILMLLNELFLGIWLILKGFNSPVTFSSSAQPS